MPKKVRKWKIELELSDGGSIGGDYFTVRNLKKWFVMTLDKPIGILENCKLRNLKIRRIK